MNDPHSACRYAQTHTQKHCIPIISTHKAILSSETNLTFPVKPEGMLNHAFKCSICQSNPLRRPQRQLTAEDLSARLCHCDQSQIWGFLNITASDRVTHTAAQTTAFQLPLSDTNRQSHLQVQLDFAVEVHAKKQSVNMAIRL